MVQQTEREGESPFFYATYNEQKGCHSSQEEMLLHLQRIIVVVVHY